MAPICLLLPLQSPRPPTTILPLLCLTLSICPGLTGGHPATGSLRTPRSTSACCPGCFLEEAPEGEEGVGEKKGAGAPTDHLLSGFLLLLTFSNPPTRQGSSGVGGSRERWGNRGCGKAPSGTRHHESGLCVLLLHFAVDCVSCSHTPSCLTHSACDGRGWPRTETSETKSHISLVWVLTFIPEKKIC